MEAVLKEQEARKQVLASWSPYSSQKIHKRCNYWSSSVRGSDTTIKVSDCQFNQDVRDLAGERESILNRARQLTCMKAFLGQGLSTQKKYCRETGTVVPART